MPYLYLGTTPLIPLPPALPAWRGEQGKTGGGMWAGGCAAPPTSPFPSFPSPRRQAAWGGGRGGDLQWLARVEESPCAVTEIISVSTQPPVIASVFCEAIPKLALWRLLRRHKTPPRNDPG